MPKETDSMLISRKTNSPNHPPIIFQDHVLRNVNQHKHLGVTLRSDLRWTDHVNEIVAKTSKLINIMKGLKFTLDRLTLETIYISFIRPILEYGSPIWDGCTAVDEAKLENIQLNAARIVTGAMHGTSNAKLYEELGWHTLAKRRDLSKLTLMYKLVNKLAPENLCSILPTVPNTSRYTTRQHCDLPHFRARTELFDKSFFPSAVRLWNELPIDVRQSRSLQVFKSKLCQPVPRSMNFPELYNFGDRFISVQHTRLRLGASQLNSHLHKIGVLHTPRCRCGSPVEDTWHFFFACPLYTVPRSKLHSSITSLAPFTLQTVLYGSSECSLLDNECIFSATHEYILTTGRFKPSGIG